MFRRIVLIVCCLLAVGSVMGRDRELSRQESDSVSHALATLWGNYIKTKAQKDGAEVSAEYMRGVQEALKLSQDNDAYFQGLSEGVVIARRIRDVESLGGFKVDVAKLAYVLSRIEMGRPSGFSEASAEQYLNFLMTKIAKENHQIEGSSEYLQKAAEREGVVKMPSGLLFEVLTEGEGDQPGPKDLVLVRYTGRLIDGTEFNSSEEGEGSTFEVSKTIPGFSEGLQLMKKGGTYRLYIPSEIGYGVEGVPGIVPGGAATIFDVELVDLRHAETQQTAAQPSVEKGN